MNTCFEEHLQTAAPLMIHTPITVVFLKFRDFTNDWTSFKMTCFQSSRKQGGKEPQTQRYVRLFLY